VPVPEPPVTELLRAWTAGDEGALDRLIPAVEAELRRLARIYMARERRGHTLQTSALANEAFVRLVDARNLRWQDRAHFLWISARLMRRVLVDHARARGMRKRGGGAYGVRPRTSSIVMKWRPSASSTAYTVTMFGWLSAATAFASRVNRARRSASSASSGGRILIATWRSRRVSSAA
jgi:RNA polymerase sigma factor (TIGR02999 family)